MNDLEKKKVSRTIGSKTIVIIGLAIAVVGIGGSFVFSKKIKGFFWEARTKAVVQIVSSLTDTHIKQDGITPWQETVSQEHLLAFAEDLKNSLPNISAIKIFTNDGTIAWTDLKNITKGYHEKGIEAELQGVKDAGHLVKEAGEATKQELGKTSML